MEQVWDVEQNDIGTTTRQDELAVSPRTRQVMQGGMAKAVQNIEAERLMD